MGSAAVAEILTVSQWTQPSWATTCCVARTSPGAGTLPGIRPCHHGQMHHVLHFPDAAGYLYCESSDGATVEPLGPAQGVVCVPVGSRVRFVCTDARQLPCLGPLAPDGLVSVDLAVHSVQDDDLAALARFTGLREINLSKARAIGDAGIAHLRGLHQLEELDLYCTRVSDAGLVHLSSLLSLRQLHLGNTCVRGSGLRWLSGLSSLRKLSVEGTQVGDASIAALPGLGLLQQLVVAGSYVTNAGAAAFLEQRPSCEIVGDLLHNERRLDFAVLHRQTLSTLVHRIVPTHPIAATMSGEEMVEVLNRLLPRGTRLEALLPAGANALKPAVTRSWDPDPALIMQSDVDHLLALLPRDAGILVTLPGGTRYSIPWLVTRGPERRTGVPARPDRSAN